MADYLISPDGSIVWVDRGPEDYQYVWEEVKDNMPECNGWD